jgi:hypothetical protein
MIVAHSTYSTHLKHQTPYREHSTVYTVSELSRLYLNPLHHAIASPNIAGPSYRQGHESVLTVKPAIY